MCVCVRWEREEEREARSELCAVAKLLKTVSTIIILLKFDYIMIESSETKQTVAYYTFLFKALQN